MLLRSETWEDFKEDRVDVKFAHSTLQSLHYLLTCLTLLLHDWLLSH